MARNEKRGKRERATAVADGKITGPKEDPEERAPGEAELAKHRPEKAEVRRRRDVE